MGLARYAARQVIHQAHHKPAARPQSRQQPRSDAKVQAAQDAQRKAHAARVEKDLKALRAQLVADQLVPVKPVLEVVPDIPVTPANPNRPKSIDEMVGQTELLTQLRIVITGALLRDTKVPNILISGAAGHGKTSLAEVIADEIMADLVPTTGMMLKKPSDLVGLLIKVEGPTVLFIDEIHTMSRLAQETLYTVLEDAKIDVIGGSGNDASMNVHTLPHLVVVGATTRPGMLEVPFRDRFGFQGVMSEYSDLELSEIVTRLWTRHNVTASDDEALELARRSKGVPRRAIHLGERVMDYAAVRGLETIEQGTVANALAIFGIDDNGLDDVDFKIITALTKDFAGRAIGLEALAQLLDLDERTLTDQYEPYLARSGLLVRSRSGRIATPAAYAMTREV